MLLSICIGLFAPLVGFLILMTASSVINRRTAGSIACLAVFISFLCFTYLLYVYDDLNLNPQSFTLFHWIPVDKINADFTLRLDPLSLVMTLIITGIGFLIHVYSIGYMEHDEDFARYFSCLNLFVFAMLLLVLAGNILLLFVGWEGVGLASYLLIGYYYERPAAAQAAVKAFVVNRIGDFGLMVGLLLTFFTFGTSEISEILNLAQNLPSEAPILILLTLLYFAGAVGKSAQLPLYTWLPDAMEGPTPVSALIHAATMVTAGVYLVVRMHPLFMMAPTTLETIGIVGGATSLFAALCACGQMDLKRVLAYSTVSQLGLMFLACGVGAFYAAMFHLTTHAFTKGLLFLAAGNVVHMMHGTTDMGKMGGLYQKFTKTHWLFLIGVLALSGIPPLSIFFSKELILEQEFVAGFHTLFFIGLAASILTAFYLTRAYCLTFLGTPKLEPKIFNAVHEAPSVMVVPVFILALLCISGGFLGYAFGHVPILESFLGEVGVSLFHNEASGNYVFSREALIALGGGLFGVALAAILYTRYTDRLGATWSVLKNSFYVNEIYNTIFVLPLRRFAQWINGFAEPKIFDGSIRLIGKATQGAAHQLQKVQSGLIRSYTAWMVLGMVILIAYYVL